MRKSELRHSNIRCMYGNPEEEEEDGCVHIFAKGAKKGQFSGKAAVARDLFKLNQDF